MTQLPEGAKYYYVELPDLPDNEVRTQADVAAGVASLEVGVAKLSNECGLAPDIAEALHADSFKVHNTGLPGTDKMLHYQMVHATVDSVATYAEIYAAGASGQLVPQRHSEPNWRRNLHAPATVLWMHQAGAMLPMGLLHRRGAERLLASLHINYAQEAGLTDGSFPGLVEQDLRLVFSDEELALATPNIAALMERMRERKIADVSRATLDARVQHAVCMFRFELGADYLEQIENFATLTPRKGERAVELFQAAQEVLATGDLEAIAWLHQKFAELCIAQVGREGNNPQAGLMLQLLAQRSLNDIASIQTNLRTFRSVYDTLQYPYTTEIIQAEQEPVTVSVSIGAVATPATITPSAEVDIPPLSDSERKALLAVLQTESAELCATAAGLTAQWRLSESARKRQGLQTLVHQLVTTGIIAKHGLPGREIELLVAPMVKDMAANTVDTLATLAKLGKPAKPNTQPITPTPDEAIALQAVIEASAQELRNRALQLGPLSSGVVCPTAPQIRTSIKRIVADWPHYRQFIQDSWPTKGVTIARTIERVLFPETAND
jgi:hypothetical protein